MQAAWQTSIHALSQTTVALAALLLWLVVFTPYLLLAASIAFVAYVQLRKRVRGATMAP
jgi:energy-coupling factor transporter transmembrane protein EcfT